MVDAPGTLVDGTFPLMWEIISGVLQTLRYGDVGTWVGGLGTTAAVVVSLSQTRRERRARYAREAVDAEERRRSFADVSAWWAGWTVEENPQLGQPNTLVEMENRSEALVYQVVITLLFSAGLGPTKGEDVAEDWPYRSVVDALAPGRWRVPVPGGWGGMSRYPGFEVAFTDLNGQAWVRRIGGSLERIPVAAPDYYRLMRPLGFASVERVG